MFVGRLHYNHDISSSQLDWQIQCDPNQIYCADINKVILSLYRARDQDKWHDIEERTSLED